MFKSNAAFWIYAIIITLSSAIFQRLTGPTHPIRGRVEINQNIIKYKLLRTHGGESDHQVRIEIPDTTVSGKLVYKRYKTDDPLTRLTMVRDGRFLAANLPQQPPAGKLLYKLNLKSNTQTASIPENKPVIIRFKGAVPPYALIPHILFMFFAMLLSNRAGLEALTKDRNPRTYALWAAGLLFLGGMILGPVVQRFAFGQFWTGIPFGHDLTDNKTLIAMVGWIIAIIAGKGGKSARGWVLAASLILLAIYLIPHSMLGSELDYSQMPTPGK